MPAWLLTDAIHSTVLLGLAWLIARRASTQPAARDFVWKVALVGGIVTATAQTQLGVRPAGTLSIPGRRVAVANGAPLVTDGAVDRKSGDPVGVLNGDATTDHLAAADSDVTSVHTAVQSAGGATPASTTRLTPGTIGEGLACRAGD